MENLENRVVVWSSASPTSWVSSALLQEPIKGDHRDIDIFFAFGDRILGLQLGPLGIEQ